MRVNCRVWTISPHRTLHAHLRFLVDDGSFVSAGQPYAEVEVMKMYMTLQLPESGHIHFNKLEGSVLESGELIATVTLEDPSKVFRVSVCPFRHSCVTSFLTCLVPYSHDSCRRSVTLAHWTPSSVVYGGRVMMC